MGPSLGLGRCWAVSETLAKPGANRGMEILHSGRIEQAPRFWNGKISVDDGHIADIKDAL